MSGGLQSSLDATARVHVQALPLFYLQPLNSSSPALPSNLTISFSSSSFCSSPFTISQTTFLFFLYLELYPGPEEEDGNCQLDFRHGEAQSPCLR